MEKKLVGKTYIDSFDPEGKSAELCATCGKCLQLCPVMKMGKEESIAEMSRLLKGEETKRVMKECTFCFNCNNYCPHDLKPYNLLMERVKEQHRANGRTEPPMNVQYFFTNKHENNWVADVYNQHSDEEKQILDKWTEPPAKSKEVLMVGCVGRMIPYGIEHSKVLSELPIYAPRDLCCGEIPHRFGDYDWFTKIIENSLKLFEKLDTERLITYCGSCTNYFGNIWPNYMGVKLPFEVVTIWEWLWDKYQKGEIKVQKKISGKFAITDSCYSSELGEKFFEAIRGLHKAVGMEVVELKNNRFENFSCGFASLVRDNYGPHEGEQETKTKIGQFKESGASDLACYCPGCFMRLRGPFKESGESLRLHYGLEEILCAFGDDPYPSSLEDKLSIMDAEMMKVAKEQNW
jgi:Fe-S oxidoreductase